MAKNILAKIEEEYNGLSKGHKRIADFICGNLDDAAFMTAAVLGKKVDVSESTVVRFSTSLGYPGYPEMQKELREISKRHLTSVQRMEAAYKRHSGSDMLDAALLSDLDNIKATRESISRSDFTGSVEAINSAKRIYILGVRSAAPLAAFAAFYMNYVYDNVTLVDASGPDEIFEQMYRISDKDVCIAISFPRYSNQTLNALKFASGRGAVIISVTDSEMSPIAAYATYLLTAKSSTVSFVDSLTAPLSLINALIASAAEERKQEVRSNLSELESIWDEYHVYRKNDGEDK